jgi:hypothetical protein
MKCRCFTRLFRRRPRPIPPTALPFQLRHRLDRLKDLYELEAVLELSRPKPDINYLLELELESSYVAEVLASLERV